MVKEELGYGPRLSDDDYDRLIVELYEHHSPMPSQKEETQLRHKELELAINHRLGIDFPEARREKLWMIMERVEQKRVRMAAKFLFRRLLHRSAIPSGLSKNAHGIAAFMVEAFAEVLNEKELRSFFDLEKGEKPSLPISPQS